MVHSGWRECYWILVMVVVRARHRSSRYHHWQTLKSYHSLLLSNIPLGQVIPFSVVGVKEFHFLGSQIIPFSVAGVKESHFLWDQVIPFSVMGVKEFHFLLGHLIGMHRRTLFHTNLPIHNNYPVS